MKLSTALFGAIDIEKDQIVQFPFGLPGFSEERQFVFLPIPDSPFTCMQSLTSDVHFIVMNPFDLFKDYEFEIPEETIERLKLEKPESVATWVIITLKEDISASTANMRAPVIVNRHSRIGKQLVLNQYHIRQPIFASIPLASSG